MTAVSRLFLVLFVATAVCGEAGARGEEFQVPLESGATLEWKHPKNRARQLKVRKIAANSEAERLGYRKGDEVVSIGGQAPGDRSLIEFLLLSRQAETFRVRRKDQELDLPPLFRIVGVIAGAAEHDRKPGQKPPELAAKTLNGEAVKLEQFAGRVVLMNFWATWCKPCMEEMPKIVDLHRQYGARGLVVLTVNLDADKSAAQKILKSSNPTFLVLHDKGLDSRTAQVYDINTLPFTLLLDRQGIIRQVVIGYSPTGFDVLFQRPIELLLANTGPVVTIVSP
ncbi:MAG: redoxin domain-containing protein [Acidobacteria bacterium]|nr:redoxin domain-containing protein [Acidobacteriota bacterium]